MAYGNEHFIHSVKQGKMNAYCKKRWYMWMQDFKVFQIITAGDKYGSRKTK